MKVRYFNLYCIVMLLIGNLQAQVPVFEKKWDQRFGGSDDDIIGSFEMTADSGFILGGSTFSDISGNITQNNYDTSMASSDFWLVRCDPSGSINWQQRFGGTLSEVMYQVIIADDGGFVAGGQSFSDDNGDKTEPNWDPTLLSYDYWVIKTDSLGSKLWDKRYGGTSYEMFGDLKEDASGNLLLAGSSFSSIGGDKTEANQGGWDYWLVYTDPSGNKIWDRRFGGLQDDYATTIAVTADSGFVIGGYSNSGSGGDKTEDSNGSWDYWIVKLNSLGTKVWDKSFGGSETDWLFALALAADNGLILGGQSYSPVSGDKSEPNHGPASDSDRWLIRTDASGNKMWDRTIGGTATEDVSRIVRLPDGGYLVSGESYSDISGDKTEDNLGPEQTWVIKVDDSGALLWDKTLFTYGHDETGTAIPYGDSCFVSINFTQADTGGYKSQMNWGDSDFWMIMMCDEDPLSVIENAGEFTCTVAPNPFTDFLEIKGLPVNQEATISLVDAAGRIVHSARIPAQQETVIAGTADLQPGFYILNVISSNGSKTFPVIRSR